MSFSDLINLYKERPFLTDDHQTTYSYGEVLKIGKEIIKPLRAEKSIVFLLSSNTVKTISAYLALLDGNHAILLLDNNISEELLERLTATYQPHYVIRADEEHSIFQQTVDDIELGNDLAILLSTSGSTGSPKLACFTEEKILENAKSIAQYLELTETEIAFAHLPIHYSFGLSVLHSHIVVGAQLRLTKYSLMQKEFWQAFKDCRATSFSGVPFHFEMLKRLRFPQVSGNLRYMSQAGGRLSDKLIIQFNDMCIDAGQKFYVMYGQTEAAPRITYVPSESLAKKVGSIGIPIPGVQLELHNDNGAIHTPNTKGELVCYSPSIMLGYALKREDLSLPDQYHGILHTGDIAVFDQDGYYTIIGRSNRFLKVQGNRVSLDDIEKFLTDKAYEVACIGVDDWLCVALKGVEEELNEVKRLLTHAYKIPPRSVTVTEIEQFPRNEYGKIQYKKLTRQMLLEHGK